MQRGEAPEPVLSEAKGRGSGGVPQIHFLFGGRGAGGSIRILQQLAWARVGMTDLMVCPYGFQCVGPALPWISYLLDDHNGAALGRLPSATLNARPDIILS